MSCPVLPKTPTRQIPSHTSMPVPLTFTAISDAHGDPSRARLPPRRSGARRSRSTASPLASHGYQDGLCKATLSRYEVRRDLSFLGLVHPFRVANCRACVVSCGEEERRCWRATIRCSGVAVAVRSTRTNTRGAGTGSTLRKRARLSAGLVSGTGRSSRLKGFVRVRPPAIGRSFPGRYP
jgi:hypothetical protein